MAGDGRFEHDDGVGDDDVGVRDAAGVDGADDLRDADEAGEVWGRRDEDRTGAVTDASSARRPADRPPNQRIVLSNGGSASAWSRPTDRNRSAATTADRDAAWSRGDAGADDEHGSPPTRPPDVDADGDGGSGDPADPGTDEPGVTRPGRGPSVGVSGGVGRHAASLDGPAAVVGADVANQAWSASPGVSPGGSTANAEHGAAQVPGGAAGRADVVRSHAADSESDVGADGAPVVADDDPDDVDRAGPGFGDGDGSPERADGMESVGAASLRPRRSRGFVALAAAAIAAVAVAAVALVIPRQDDDPVSITATAPELPTGAEIAWSQEVGGSVEAAAVGDGRVAVASSDELTVLDDLTGEVVWRRVHADDTGDIEAVAVMGGNVVITQQGSAGTTEVRAFDRDTGTEVWRTGRGDGSFSISGTPDDPLIVGRARLDQSTVLTVLDPVDGTTLADPVRLSGVEATGRDVAVIPSDRRVAVWSTDELAIVAGPVDAFNLRTVAALDGSVVALDLEGRIVAFDGDGRRSDELLLVDEPSAGDAAAIAQVDLVGVVAQSGVGVISDASSLGFAVVDGAIRIVWERTGHAGSPTATTRGDLVIVLGPIGDGGEVAEVIVDAGDGTTVRPIAAPGPRERVSTLAGNGYVVAPALDAAERVLSAVDYDGAELWTLQLPEEADYLIAAGVIVITEPTPDGTVVSVAR